jgi:hypothetical protein
MTGPRSSAAGEPRLPQQVPAAVVPAGVQPALGPMVGGWLFIRIGHHVWPVLAIGSLIATVLVLFAVRARSRTLPSR